MSGTTKPALRQCWRRPVASGATPRYPRLIVVGGGGGTALGSSFVRAAAELGLPCQLCDTAMASSSLRLANAAAWRLGQRSMPFAGRLRRELRVALAVPGDAILLTTGLAPLRAADLGHARSRGVTTVHFSSDDPWNPNFKAAWHLQALTEYDIVFTPRRSNLADFRTLGCREVRYLPFGYDPALFPEADERNEADEIPRALFVGGADQDRARFIRLFRRAGGKPTLVGGYWGKFADLNYAWLGHLDPGRVAQLTRSAAVNLVLVRRANRDGHTMRSFEAGAIGGCLLVQDTPEHREIFGPDEVAVRYFDTPEQAAELYRGLIEQPGERARLARAVAGRIRGGKHTYRDRLEAILAAVNGQPQASLPSEVCHV